MIAGIELRYLYHDADVIEVRIVAQNSRFRGSADVYIGTSCLIETAKAIEGFPANSQDTRDVTLGAFGNDFAGGAVRLEFFCKDIAGHSTVRITIESGEQRPPEPASGQIATLESTVLYVDFEPAGLDEFVAELKEIEQTLGGSAVLRTDVI